MTHSHGILPVSRDNMIVLRACPANNATTASAVMTAIELKGKGKERTRRTVNIVQDAAVKPVLTSHIGSGFNKIHLIKLRSMVLNLK